MFLAQYTKIIVNFFNCEFCKYLAGSAYFIFLYIKTVVAKNVPKYLSVVTISKKMFSEICVCSVLIRTASVIYNIFAQDLNFITRKMNKLFFLETNRSHFSNDIDLSVCLCSEVHLQIKIMLYYLRTIYDILNR